MSDTPRTDEERSALMEIPGAHCMAELCGQLERELTAEKARAESLEEFVKKFHNYMSASSGEDILLELVE